MGGHRFPAGLVSNKKDQEVNTPLHIVVLSDGKAGHLNQSLGLYEALQRITPCKLETISVGDRRFPSPTQISKPDLILAAGHRTHLPLLLLSKRLGCMSVVLMKPSLPTFLFDLCIIPRHDLKGANPPKNIIPSTGALNRVPPPGDQERQGGLILLGGPSSHHGWDEVGTRKRVCSIVEAGSERPWRATDSRRTPEDTLQSLQKQCSGIAIYPHQSTGPEWLPQRLAEAHETWVTEDSVSMIYEALSSGTRVGILPSPKSGTAGRIARGIQRLIAEKWVTPFEQWKPGDPLAKPPEVLREADRIAEIVLDRLLPQSTPSA